MYYVTVEKGVKVAVEDMNPCGQKAILLIHGWPLSQKIFEYQRPLLIDRGYRVVSMDLRGFGQSDTPCGSYCYDRMATDIYRVVRSIGLKAFILAGFSMGGAIALRYLSKFRGYGVTRLCLLGAAAPSFIQRPGFPYGLTCAEANQLIAQSGEDRPQMVSAFGEKLFARPHSQPLKDWFRDISFSASGTGTLKTAIALRDEDLRGELKCVSVPTGIFHGKKDEICPFTLAEQMKSSIPCSVLYPFEDSGHAVFYDNLDSFNHCLIEFLEC